MKNVLLITGLLAGCTVPVLAQKAGGRKPTQASPKRPNILIVVSDDQSYPYASAYGNTTARTPAFDRVAAMGILFNNAYVTSPGSAPSRASILTGRFPWQNEEAGTHASDFPRKLRTFPEMLQAAGYHIGITGKGWGPGEFANLGWPYNPAGPSYDEIKNTPPYKGILNNDYAANFEVFLKDREEGQPFYFWFGCKEPHRSYEQDVYKKAGRTLDEALVPAYLPDNDVVRGDILDYATEIEWFDLHLGRMLRTLEEIGELDNTLILVTADNGMPFPRSKGNCYDQGVHVPFAVSWPAAIPGGRVVDDLVSMVNLAPTILDATGSPHLGDYPFAGESMMPVFRSTKQGMVTSPADQVIFSCRERHSSARYNNWGYPQRMLRTQQYLYVRNLHPERWPSGDPQAVIDGDGTLGEMHGAYHDIDRGPAVEYMKRNHADPAVKPYFDLSMAKRPYEELYDLNTDPYCLHNIVDNAALRDELVRLRGVMDAKLRMTGDSRVLGGDPEIWEGYPRHSPLRYFPNPDTGEIESFPTGAF